MRRLNDLPTLKIDSSRAISFNYNGRAMMGYSGDSVASALYANGVRIFSRSLKYHRPRGLYSMDGESSNCMMTVDGLPNVHAEKTLLRKGMSVSPQNVLGTAEWDFWSFLDYFHWAMPAGFFYRMFHKPYRFWPFFQKHIRNMAGLGRFNPEWQPGESDAMYLNADVCVVGAGPAGLNAALAAANQGLRVVIFEGRPWLGGFYAWRRRKDADGLPLHDRTEVLASQLRELPNVRLFTHAGVNGIWGDNLVTAVQIGESGDHFSERYIEVRSKSVVIATGCNERPLVFEHNERPGVMQAACAQRLAMNYGILPGAAVFSVGDDLGLEAAVELADLGADIKCVADSRVQGHDTELAAALAARKIPFLPGWSASKTLGWKVVKGVKLTSLNGPGEKEFACDTLVASAGLAPNQALLLLARGKAAYDTMSNSFLPSEFPPGVHAAGRLMGHGQPESIEASGRLAGLAAAQDNGAKVSRELKKVQDQLARSSCPVEGSRVLVSRGCCSSNSFVCFDEDVTVKNLKQSVQYGFDVPELAKRFTAAGTGPSQGGIPGHNLPLILAELHEGDNPAIQPTNVRPPLTPTLFSTYAAHNHDIFKKSPLHEEQVAAGAVLRRIGVWKRARYFSQDFSSKEEVRNVRENVGLIDVSTLGKFRIFGPDAEKALDRVYVGNMRAIQQGRVKYSAMVNDDANLVDDGVIAKLGENDFYFTASTARAGMTSEWIKYHSLNEGWEFNIVTLTDAIGAINVAGPNARKVLEKLTDADISAEAFPYLGYRELLLCSAIPARVMRLGFVGELSYELHVPSSYCRFVWQSLMEAGKEFGIRPFGLEAQSALRLEKGHVIIGQESEIRTTLHDQGMGFAWYRGKPEAKTVGAPALHFTENQQDRLKLVGIQMEDAAKTPGDGALIVDGIIRGHVCTARYSHALGKSIGLALVDAPLAKEGTRLKIFQEDMGEDRLTATVVPTPFYDPEGKRQRM
jgi:sarcosine oxidase, subunit alpha